jgi:hypothetical protein
MFTEALLGNTFTFFSKRGKCPKNKLRQKYPTSILQLKTEHFHDH